MTDAAAPLSAVFAAGLPGAAGGRLGLAVSGGGDSMAMLHLAAAHARKTGLQLAVVTVDHGLRPEAAAEAELVRKSCQALDIPHETLHWERPEPRGNLQGAAREGRYRLIAGWAQGAGIDRVALAHTRDDVAETFLMRLARGAGVDGLSAMAADRRAFGIRWLRPLLAVGRAELRAYLRAQGHAWCEDPSNEDTRFGRVRARQALAALGPLGIEAETLARVAGNLAEARDALQVQTRAAAVACARIDAGDVLFDRPGLAAQPPEIKRRLVAQALQWIASAPYGPRAQSLLEVLAAIEAGRKFTLHGCLGLPAGAEFRVTREYSAVIGQTVPAPGPWDGRWRMTGPEAAGAVIAALGESGLAECPDWRETGRPRDSLLSAPALWRDGQLLAAPLARKGDRWQAVAGTDCDIVFDLAITH